MKNEWVKRLKEAGYDQHWAMNDSAHQEGHFSDVFDHGIYINNKLNLGFKEEHIFLVAYFHDLFAWSRDNHEQLSHAYVLTSKCPVLEKLIGEDPTGSIRNLCAMACKEHRASYTPSPSYYSTFSDLMASADRPLPKSKDEYIKGLVERATNYRKDKFPTLSNEEIITGVGEHLKDKFGVNGYQAIPDSYRKLYGKQLDSLSKAVDNLTIHELTELVMNNFL